MEFLQFDFHGGPHDVVRVTLSAAANVRLMDSSNFSSYRARRAHRFVGGYYRSSPVLLRPPHEGHWYVTVDIEGYRGTVRASFEVV